jgi:MOSC domain-containing protein YiiM
MGAVVEAVHASPSHSMRKPTQSSIRLLAGLGVEGDAHMGMKVQHLFRVRQNPDEPNLRQVHLIHAELHDELRSSGFAVAPGEMGENITTRGVDLLALPTGARLHIGAESVVEITGLRNPCRQLNGLEAGLMDACLDRDAEGGLIRKAGVMGIVLIAGEVSPNDAIVVEMPPEPYLPLEPV